MAVDAVAVDADTAGGGRGRYDALLMVLLAATADDATGSGTLPVVLEAASAFSSSKTISPSSSSVESEWFIIFAKRREGKEK